MASLSNPSRVTNDLFGFSVAIAGTRMVVGAPLNDTEGHDAGRAYVYDPASGTPAAPLVTLTNPSPYSIDDSFGFSVAGFETLIAVGAPRGEFVTVYDLGSAVPAAPVAMLTKPNPSSFERFGHSVAISGTRVVVGVPNAYPPGPPNSWWWAAGSVCVFDLASSTPTTPILTLTNPSPAWEDVFGYSVAASGTRIIVGAPYDDDSAPDGGNAYVYDLATVPCQPYPLPP